MGGYSLGMRQRLALAGALLGDPETLILDEPANGLDPQGIRWLRDLLRELAAGGRTVFLSSHVLSEMAQIADSVAIINRGASCSTHRSTTCSCARPPDPRAQPAGGAAPRAARAERGRGDHGRGRAFTATGTTAESIGELAANGIVLHELHAEASSLEDVFLQLTREDES